MIRTKLTRGRGESLETSEERRVEESTVSPIGCEIEVRCQVGIDDKKVLGTFSRFNKPGT